MNLSDYFEAVLTCEDTKVRKPSAKAFDKILKKLDLNPEEVLMVGDSLDKDIQGAKEIGMKTCFAKYGDMGLSNNSINPDYIIYGFDEILKIVGEGGK